MIVNRTRAGAAGLAVLGAVCLALGVTTAKDTKARLQKDLNGFLIEGDWNCDEIRGALRRAAKEGKPVLVVFR